MYRAPAGLAGRALRLLTVTALAALLALTALPAYAATTTRLGNPAAEASNTQKAIAYSTATFAAGAAPTVLLAREDDFADTLTSAAVQRRLGAPLLLTNSQTLSPDTAAELERLGAQRVIIMGGPMAVSENVENQLMAMNRTVTRVFGETRVETAVAVATQFFPSATDTIVARAFPAENEPTTAFADSLAAGNYAAVSNVPVLLTDTETLAGPTAAYLNASFIESAAIAGGVEAVSAQVESQIAAISTAELGTEDGTFDVVRFFGATRSGTAVALSQALGYTTAAEAPRILLIEGFENDAWASGLAAGAQAGNGIATVLAGETLPDETKAFLAGATGIPLICGPDTNESACNEASMSLGNEG